ncbi:MAG: DHH family phosphoesterase [Candidatus Aenigmarchaeota archaeon]|nr:DHH family phosphoesterase [Candidatus Aenigmarchaeota archaeon]
MEYVETMKTLDNLYSEAAEWLKQIRKSGLIAVVYHRDSDGVCSAVMAAKILKHLGCGSVKIVPCDVSTPAVTPALMRSLSELQPDYLVFVDMAVDQDPNPLVLLKQKYGTKIIVIDHHPMSMDLNMLDIKHINTRSADPRGYFPAAYMMYKIAGKLSGELARDHSWVALVGTIGDHGIDNCPDLVKDFSSAYGRIATTQKDFSQTKYGKASEYIMSAKASDDDGIETARIVLDRAINADAFLSAKTLKEWHANMQAVINHMVDNFEKDAELNPNANIAVYTIKTDRRIESVVASILSDKFPRMTIVVCRESQERIGCSLRNQKSADVSSLARASIAGLKDARGGGHPQAAAASVKKSDWAAFKNALINNSTKYPAPARK